MAVFVLAVVVPRCGTLGLVVMVVVVIVCGHGDFAWKLARLRNLKLL